MSQYCTTNATLPTTNHKTAFHSCFQATVTVKKTGDLVNIKMDGDKASRFVSSLVKSIQALCNGYIDFSSSIEVIGHIHLNIDRSVKLDYVLTEEVSKSVSEGSTLFASHSYHSQPPSKSDSSSRNRQKQSAGVSQGDEGDSTFRSSSSEVHNTSSKSDSHSHRRSHYGENSVSSHTGSFVDTSDSVLVKQEHRQNMCQSQESLDRRRRNAPSQPQSHRSSSPAAKRSRQSDCNPEQDQNFEVIEIKEEPEDEPAVFFGNSSSHMAAGQDVQTPDFSNVVMESLDRVGQVEGTNLVASGDGGQMQQQPFPVMMHANSGMSSSSASSSAPGPLLSDPQSLASTSGTPGGDDDVDSIDYLVPSSLADLDFIQPTGYPADISKNAGASDHSLHALEKGEGKNHRCIVCQRRHSQYLRDHPRTHASNNPFKRSKTSFRCSACKVYLCAQEERQCWWVWHQTLTDASSVESSSWPQGLEDDQCFIIPESTS
ncbi:uncharacterized protein LOC143293889 isoform X4 [Babylonia areolata]|uniref:uncharacterized protein LOC143293889 isoform X4 n=1 Tax=Babylonia areolata TaxID=304850 RepID=UPI003FD4CBC5